MGDQVQLAVVATFALGLFSSANAQDWERTSAPFQLWSGVACSENGERVFAASRFAFRYEPGGICFSTNFGSIWELTGAPVQHWGRVACSADGLKVAAIGESSPTWPSFAGIYLSTNGGSNWTCSSAPATGWYRLTMSRDGSKLAGAVWAGGLYFSTNSGSTWTQSKAPTLYWRDIAASADGQKLVASGGDMSDPNICQIYLSTDAGMSWRAVANSPTRIIALTSSADGAVLLGVSGGELGIYRSGDAGKTWQLTTAPAWASFQAIACSADGEKVAAAAGTMEACPVYTSADSGKTWLRSGLPDGYYNSVACSADGAKWVVCEGGITAGYVYRFQIPPEVFVQPKNQTAEMGSRVRFSLSGSKPFGSAECSWFLNETNAVRNSCKTNALLLTDVQAADAGAYTAVLKYADGSVTSAPAMLRVIPAVERRMVPTLTLSAQEPTLLSVEHAESLVPLCWVPLAQVELNTSPQFLFMTNPLPPQRFYRASSPQGAPGLGMHMVPAITLSGPIGSWLCLDYINQFGPVDAWVTLDQRFLTNASEIFFDTSAIEQPPRLYRLRMP